MKVKNPPPDLVSVVIPAYNAAATLDRTLLSVRAQTHEALEIIVVDDGSRDATPALVSDHAARDPRVRLVRQDNAGVAAARNRGIGEARGDFLAPIDADDLWAPTKIALQMQAMASGGPKVGLVYTWFAIIDAEDRILSARFRPTAEGWVLRELCRMNFIGNASSCLIRRTAFEAAGGYDVSLRARQAQGCEDLLLSLAIAETFEFRVVRQPLTGYRKSPTNMSSDTGQMLRSFNLVASRYRGRYPEYANELDAQWERIALWLLARAIGSDHRGEAFNLAAQILKRQGSGRLRRCRSLLLPLFRSLIPRPAKRFVRRVIGAPAEAGATFIPARNA